MNIVNAPRILKNCLLLVSIVSASLVLTACGGSKSSSTTASSSSISSHTFSSATVIPSGSGIWPYVKVSAKHTKSLDFEWSSVEGATYYKLLKQANEKAELVQVGTDFTTTTISDSVSVHLTDWLNTQYKVQACNTTGCFAESKPIVTNSAMINAITYAKASNAEAGDWFGWSLAISGDGKTMAVGAPVEASQARGVTNNSSDKTNNDSPAAGAVYVFTKVNGNWVEEAYLKASNTEQPDKTNTDLFLPGDRFGFQVSLSRDGNTLAVGAINEDSLPNDINCGNGSDYTFYTYTYSSSSLSSDNGHAYHKQTNIGAIYIFNRTNSAWSQTAFVKPYLPYNHFGEIFTLSGDGKTLAVGVPTDYVATQGITPITTSAKCIDYSSSSSSNSSSSSTSSSSDSSSSSSSSSNSSSSSSAVGGTNSGGVYIYNLEGTDWKLTTFIKAAESTDGDAFGISVALNESGDILAVGATGEDSITSAQEAVITLNGISNNLNTGAVYIYQKAQGYLSEGNWIQGVWSESAKIKPSNNEWRQLFGQSIALSADGTTLAVGTPGDWCKTECINKETGAKTYTVEALLYYDSTEGKYLNKPKYDSTYATGAVYIFTLQANTWVQQAYLKASNSKPFESFGAVVALSQNGNILAVGTKYESSLATGINGDDIDTSSNQSGAAYVFIRSNTTWSQKSYVKAPINHSSDRFAHAIALDYLGETLAIGAYKESSNAVGINGNQNDVSAPSSGAVYLY